jgi:hypothetical protein
MRYLAEYKKTGGNWTALPDTSSLLVDVDAEPGIYYARVTAINAAGTVSLPAQVGPVTILGKTAPPADVTNLTIDGIRLAWSLVADIDLSGYLIRYQYGSNTEWETANALHDGILTSSPYTMESVPPGVVTIMVRAIDTTGNVSKLSAYVITNLGNPLVANVVEDIDYRSLIWPGTITNSTVVGGNLQADQSALFYRDDVRHFYQLDGAAFYSENYDPMVWESAGWTPTLAADGSNMTAIWTVTGDSVQVQYRQTGPTLFYGSDLSAFYADDSSSFYQSPPDWQSWPGTVVAQAQEYQWRVSTREGPSIGLLSAFVVSVDVPDKMLKLNSVPIESGGSRLSGSVGQFNVIQNIQLTLQGGSTAVMLEASDYANALGPLVVAKNSAGSSVSATIDALLQGY